MLDWRRKAATVSDVRTTIRDVLDAELPADPYPPAVFDAKVQQVFDHVISAYGDDGSSVYQVEELTREAATSAAVATIDVRTITDQVIERIKVDEEFAALVAAKLGRSDPPERTVSELIHNDEDSFVEFKSTARWDLREGRRNKDLEDSIVKSVAAFLNSGDGTL